MPGFGPAAEVLLVRQKDPKPVMPRPAYSDGVDERQGRAGQFAQLRQRPPVHDSVHPWVRAAGVDQEEEESSRVVGNSASPFSLTSVIAGVHCAFSNDGGRRKQEGMKIILNNYNLFTSHYFNFHCSSGTGSPSWAMMRRALVVGHGPGRSW